MSLLTIVIVIDTKKTKALRVVPSNELALQLAAFASDESVYDAYPIVYDVPQDRIDYVLDNYKDSLR
jgi:hypothetical protein